MNVLITANSAWNIWNFRKPVVEALLRDGNSVSVLAPWDEKAAQLEQLGCRFQPLEMSVKGMNPFEDLQLERRFKRIFRRAGADVILSYTIKNNIYGARAARPLGIPFVPNVTGLGTAFLSNWLLQSITEQLYRRSFKSVPTVFFQNEDDQGLFLDHKLVRPDQAHLLPGSGIDLAFFETAPMPAADKAPVFLMIGRLLRDKGVTEFVDAARRIKTRHPTARFQLLGATDAKNRSAIDASTLQKWLNEGVVEYLGTTDDVRHAIEDASCVVLPSYREGAPRALIEAAAMARPLIATDVPGCRSVVDHGVSGLLCEPRNAQSLADSIETMLGLSPAERTAMGHAGRAKMERAFGHDIVVEAYRSVISRISSGQTGG